MPEIGPSGSEGGAKISFAPTPILMERSPSLRDGSLLFTIGVGAKEIFAPPSEPDGPISGIRLSS